MSRPKTRREAAVDLMIHFLTTLRNRFTIRAYLADYGAALAGGITPLVYEALPMSRPLQMGTYIFADLELLTDRQRSLASHFWQRLADHGCRLLNHPTHSLRRYDLLKALHARGSNCFNVHRPDDLPGPRRFPVFLRGENDHRGCRSSLLSTQAELARELRRCRRPWRRIVDPLITEFCDTADERGIYRKYSAFRVGRTILPRHLFFSDSWHIKQWRLLDDAMASAEREYMASNPHEAALREIFSLARIDYGRVDYALRDGVIQVWEINTNPVILHRRGRTPVPRAALHDLFAERFRAALLECEGEGLQAA